MMQVLLDTHLLLWALQDSDKLPDSFKDKVLDGTITLAVSAASIWEISIKHMEKPQSMKCDGTEIAQMCAELGIPVIPIGLQEIRAYETLKRNPLAPEHKDPFDRMLIAQAKAAGFVLFTQDKRLTEYGEYCVNLI